MYFPYPGPLSIGGSIFHLLIVVLSTDCDVIKRKLKVARRCKFLRVNTIVLASTSTFNGRPRLGLRCLLLLMRTRPVHHASISSSARALGLTLDEIKYAIKYTTKIKAKLSYCDQIKFNEPVLEPGTPEKQHIANH